MRYLYSWWFRQHEKSKRKKTNKIILTKFCTLTIPSNLIIKWFENQKKKKLSKLCRTFLWQKTMIQWNNYTNNRKNIISDNNERETRGKKERERKSQRHTKKSMKISNKCSFCKWKFEIWIRTHLRASTTEMNKINFKELAKGKETVCLTFFFSSFLLFVLSLVVIAILRWFCECVCVCVWVRDWVCYLVDVCVISGI